MIPIDRLCDLVRDSSLQDGQIAQVTECSSRAEVRSITSPLVASFRSPAMAAAVQPNMELPEFILHHNSMTKDISNSCVPATEHCVGVGTYGKCDLLLWMGCMVAAAGSVLLMPTRLFLFPSV